MRISTASLAALLALSPLAAHAGEPDADTAAALQETQQSLKDPAQRSAAINNSKAAADADAQVRALAKTDADTQAIYELSAEIMKTLTDASGGDAEKMMQLLEDAKSHPEKLAAKLTPEQRQKLAQLAKQLDAATAAAATKPAAPARQ